MWDFFKNKLSLWLLAEERDFLMKSCRQWEKMNDDASKRRETQVQELRALENKRKEIEANELARVRKDLSVVDLVREKLGGFNPKLLDGVKLVAGERGEIDVLADIFADAKKQGYDSDNDFLAEAKKLSDNRALPVIFDYIRRNQIIYSSGAARNMDMVTFSGGTINGVELVREQIGQLRAIFEERSTPPEKFDRHEAV